MIEIRSPSSQPNNLCVKQVLTRQLRSSSIHHSPTIIENVANSFGLKWTSFSTPIAQQNGRSKPTNVLALIFVWFGFFFFLSFLGNGNIAGHVTSS
jgi:hypothetical protein